MKKHRGLFLALGLTALFGLSAREARAEAMILTVSLNGTSIFSATGPTTGPNAHQAVSVTTAGLTVLNGDLSGTGYSFSSLGGASNNPGTSGPVGGFISDSGNVSFAPGGSGGVLTITVSEVGFTAPSSGTSATLTSAATANYSGAGAGGAGPTPTYQTYSGMFSDSSLPPVTATTPLITQLANGTASDQHSASTSTPIAPYLTPYSLTSATNIDLTASSSSPSNDVFTGKTSVVSASVPEPASLVMMLTGMPLPLVVMGLLRRRRRAAA